jgi:hypothetical protein
MMNSPMKRCGFGFLVRYDLPVETRVIISQTPQAGEFADHGTVVEVDDLAKAHQSGNNRALTFTVMPWTSENECL